MAQNMQNRCEKPELSSFSDDLIVCLDWFAGQLTHHAEPSEIDNLIQRLCEFYDSASATNKLADFRRTCQSHPIHSKMLEDPFTQRAFLRPRGYAGDAAMLDFIYRPTSLNLTPLGNAIHSITTGVSTAQSILWRRDHLGHEIAKTASEKSGARILSIASGHIRELDIVRPILERRDFQIVALDHDEKSLHEAVASNTDFDIIPLNRSISYILKNEISDKYDLIYSAGLFDYLTTPTAEALLIRLFKMLSPAGRIIVGNYAPENYGRGYMEGMMNWSLIYRNECDMARLIGQNFNYRVYRDGPGNVVYVEAYRN